MFLYLVKCQQYVKIGIANDVQNRLAQLSTGNPFDLEILAVYEFKNASPVESALHQRFENYQARGEWYSLSDDAVKQIEDICRMLGDQPVESPVVESEDIAEAEEMAEAPVDAKYDFAAMFADGWRMENVKRKGSHDSWIWRRGSGVERKSIYGGTVSSLPYPIEEMRKYFRKP